MLINDALKKAKGWILWRAIPKGDKVIKQPFKLDGSRNEWNKTNYGFDEVSKIFNQGGYTGIGLQPKDNLICIDLDNCLDPNDEPTGYALDILKLGSYTEISPSGKGLHVWINSTKKIEFMQMRGLEIFSRSKYVTITGNIYKNLNEVKTLDISHIIQRYFPDRVSGNDINFTADPTLKSGPIGAFCRAIDIHKALEMTGMYTKYDDRYQYNPSNSAPGVVIYENKWVISNHASDPANGGQHNAFDIVRIHKFGRYELDSFDNMVAFALTIPEVKIELDNNNIQWRKKLIRDDKHKIMKCYKNIELILDNEFELSFNEFTKEYYLESRHWKKKSPIIRDADLSMLNSYFDTEYQMCNCERKIRDAVVIVCEKHTFHPIKDYFDQLPSWDGVPRVENLLINGLGAENNDYTKAVTKKTLAAMYRRIYEPGIKFDYCLTLIGKTGIRKSTLFNYLVGDNYFSDDFNLNDTKDKTGSEKTLHNWVIEIGELSGMRKADRDIVKSFMTRRIDKFRPAFGRVMETHPRSCVFVATSNEDNGILKDITGGRRWWIVRVNEKWDGILDRDQIWAEIKARYKDEPLYLDDDLELYANKIQSENIEADERVSIIEEFINKKIPSNWYDIPLRERPYTNLDTPQQDWVPRTKIIVKEIWCDLFGKNIADLSRTESNKIVACFIKIGLIGIDKTARCGVYGVNKCYYKK